MFWPICVLLPLHTAISCVHTIGCCFPSTRLDSFRRYSIYQLSSPRPFVVSLQVVGWSSHPTTCSLSSCVNSLGHLSSGVFPTAVSPRSFVFPPRVLSACRLGLVLFAADRSFIGCICRFVSFGLPPITLHFSNFFSSRDLVSEGASSHGRHITVEVETP